MRSPLTQLYVHLVWSTWDRAPWITPEVRPRLYAAIAQRCKEMKCAPLAIGGIDDHVHVLVSLHPATSVADLVKDIKGASSHLMNHVIQPGGDFRWQGAYGAFTIRQAEVDQVKSYIMRQAEHHAAQDLDLIIENNEDAE